MVATEFQKQKGKMYTIANENGEAVAVNGDEIMKMPDGSLTTVYHYLKNSNIGIEDVLKSTQFEEVEL